MKLPVVLLSCSLWTHNHPKRMMLCRFNAVDPDYNEQILSNKTIGKLTAHVVFLLLAISLYISRSLPRVKHANSVDMFSIFVFCSRISATVWDIVSSLSSQVLRLDSILLIAYSID